MKMQKLIRNGVYALLGCMIAFGTTSCHKDGPYWNEAPTVTTVYNISGSVAAMNGKGIQNATVVLSGTENATVKTDANGYFLFSNVKTGDYTIKVSAEGKVSRETTVKVINNGKGQNVVWNVMLPNIEAEKEIKVTNQGGEGAVVTEALEGNEKAEIDVEVNVDSDDLNKNATIKISPIYDESEAAVSRAVTKTMMVGAKLSCSDSSVRIEKPIEITFNVDEVTTAEVKAQKYVNGNWVDVPCRMENGKVIVEADSFTSYGLFAGINFTSSTRHEALKFGQNVWDNINGTRPMTVGETTYTYKVGMDIQSQGTTVFTALLIEALAREFGANSYTTQGKYPINMDLPMGYYLELAGDQDINSVKATVGSRSVSGTQYGDVTITHKLINRNHTGGSNRPI